MTEYEEEKKMKKEKPSLVVRVEYEINRIANRAEIEAYQTLYPEKSFHSESCQSDIVINSQQLKENKS